MWLLKWVKLVPVPGGQARQDLMMSFDTQQDLFTFVVDQKLRECTMLFIDKYSTIIQPPGLKIQQVS